MFVPTGAKKDDVAGVQRDILQGIFIDNFLPRASISTPRPKIFRQEYPRSFATRNHVHGRVDMRTDMHGGMDQVINVAFFL